MKKKWSLTALLLSLSLVLGACAPANGGTDKEDTTGAGHCHNDTVELLADHTDGLSGILIQRQKD